MVRLAQLLILADLQHVGSTPPCFMVRVLCVFASSALPYAVSMHMLWRVAVDSGERLLLVVLRQTVSLTRPCVLALAQQAMYVLQRHLEQVGMARHLLELDLSRRLWRRQHTGLPLRLCCPSYSSYSSYALRMSLISKNVMLIPFIPKCLRF